LNIIIYIHGKFIQMIKNILVTGGTGYVGSHISVKLLELGYNVTLVDNFSNS